MKGIQKIGLYILASLVFIGIGIAGTIVGVDHDLNKDHYNFIDNSAQLTGNSQPQTIETATQEYIITQINMQNMKSFQEGVSTVYQYELLLNVSAYALQQVIEGSFNQDGNLTIYECIDYEIERVCPFGLTNLNKDCVMSDGGTFTESCPKAWIIVK